MKFRFIFREALQALRANALRSSLTIVGIIVGIFSVTVMLALGEGLKGNVLDQFNSFSTGDITVVGEVTASDFQWIKEQAYVDGAVAFQSVGSVDAVAGGSAFNPSVEVALGDYEDVKGLDLVSGTGFDWQNPDYAERVVLITEGFLESVREDTGQDISEGEVILAGQRFKVIGVVEGGTGAFGQRGDGTVTIPYASAIGLLSNTTNFSSVGVSLVDNQYYEVAAKHMLEALNSARGVPKDSEDLFSVTSAQDAIESATETISMITLFLGIVGGISLFVGGIGTMNMMLTTVTERTREIGLRKAIGARRGDILGQILVESVMLTTIGGAIGIALTYGVSLLANYLLTEDSIIKVVMSSSVVMYATLVSVAVGIVFGFYPARNAARLQPVDALRAE